MKPITRALISVTDKTGLVEFATFLASHKIEILSTGGTAKLLRDNGVPVVEVSAFTGFPGNAGRPGQDPAPQGSGASWAGGTS